MSEETKSRIAAAHRGGHLISAATKEKMAEAAKARCGVPLTQERREKMRIAHTGKSLTAEHRESIRLGLMGHQHSEEAKRRMSEAKKKTKWKAEDVVQMIQDGATVREVHEATGAAKSTIRALLKNLRATP